MRLRPKGGKGCLRHAAVPRHALDMGEPAKQQRRATFADLEAVPAHKVAELIHGALHVMPRPAGPHTLASSSLGMEIGGPFQRGRGGPGGWWILDEPELHLPDPTAPDAVNALVPDLAGWRIERMPEVPDAPYITLAPDWICEVLSPSTEELDREVKMPVYARESVRHAWLLDPVARTLEIYELTPERRWRRAAVYRDNDCVRVAPFEAIELELAVLWRSP
jgi:Uma2 family endonuclease